MLTPRKPTLSDYTDHATGEFYMAEYMRAMDDYDAFIDEIEEDKQGRDVFTSFLPDDIDDDL